MLMVLAHITYIYKSLKLIDYLTVAESLPMTYKWIFELQNSPCNNGYLLLF